MVSTAVSVVNITVWLSFTILTDWMLQQMHPSTHCSTQSYHQCPLVPAEDVPASCLLSYFYNCVSFQHVNEILTVFFCLCNLQLVFSCQCIYFWLFWPTSLYTFIIFHPDWDPKIKTSFCNIDLNKTEVLPVVLLLAVIKQWGHLRKANKH